MDNYSLWTLHEEGPGALFVKYLNYSAILKNIYNYIEVFIKGLIRERFSFFFQTFSE